MKPANILKYTFILFVAAIYILGSILVNSTYIPEYITDIKGIYDVSSEKPNIVTRVIDGDTVEMWNGDIVRYIGIDTPEIGSKKECYGENAKTANEQLVLGKEVVLEKDVSETDRYGRLLRYVYIVRDDSGDAKFVSESSNRIFINEELVKQGYAEAKAYPPDTKYQELLEDAETQAKQNNIGMWNDCN